jgi:site-specific recombinase XerD
MITNYNLLFYLKKPKKYETGPKPIYMRITVDGKCTELTIARKCLPERWCSKSHREKGTKDSTKGLNSYLDELERQLENVHLKLVSERKKITAQTLKNKFLNRGNKDHYLIMLFKAHNTEMESLIGIEFKKNTLKGYQTTINHLQSYIKLKYKKPDLEIDRLDYLFIYDFDHYLKKEANCDPVTVAKYIKHLKKVVNHCIRTKLLKDNPFSEYKPKTKIREREFLTSSQLDKIINRKIELERVAQVRDVFVFCCYTGLSYADVKKLSRKEISTGIDGEQWVMTKREKTETSSRIPLLKPALDIIEKYKGHPRCENEGIVLPVFSNQKVNSYLKEIAKDCDIPQNLTFHLARHTFATTVTLTNGVPIESVSKMLGHIDIKTTQHYAKVIDEKISEDMKALQRKLDKESI